MITALLLLIPLAGLLGWGLYSVSWRGEDWKRLRLDDSWDASKSRGRLYKGWLR
jgi:hypothetical protein